MRKIKILKKNLKQEEFRSGKLCRNIFMLDAVAKGEMNS